MSIDRRTFTQLSLAATAIIGAPAIAAKSKAGAFPKGFLWGASTSGHQTEGNNTASDFWWMEHCAKTMFQQPSGDATNSFQLWSVDMDLAKALGLNSYRFSLEWARIEPEEGKFSTAMLDHYRRMIAGCRARGLTPVVTFNHFTCPRWFAAKGGWSNLESSDLFARYCDKAARALAADIGYALTLNEPNLPAILAWAGLPPYLYKAHADMLSECALSLGKEKFSAGFLMSREDYAPLIPNLSLAHTKGRAAIKAARDDLPVGISIAVSDDQAVGTNSLVPAKRAEAYEPWFAIAKGDDFIGIQNYDRMVLDANGPVAPSPEAPRNALGAEVYPASLAGALRYVHATTQMPILVTEHGLGSDDDALRSTMITEALTEVRKTLDEGVSLIGYLHWSLLDNFEWYFGFGPKFGLTAIDQGTFRRIPKGSAKTLSRIAKANRL